MTSRSKLSIEVSGSVFSPSIAGLLGQHNYFKYIVWIYFEYLDDVKC